MIHHSCDCCKCLIDPRQALRYVVRMEVYAAAEPSDSDEREDDRDHLAEIQDILERMEDTEGDEIGDDVYQQLRFDLCGECQKRFLRDPLGRHLATQFEFSEN